MSRVQRLLIPILLSVATAKGAFAQTGPKDPLGAARDLYAAARYDEALAVLNDLRPEESASTAEVKSIEQYRSLCLLALGRGDEAETAIGAVVMADPSYLPADSEASPRVRAAFSEVRRRLLPDIVTTRYTDAKAAFDKKQYGDAVAGFKRVIALLDDPDMGGRLPDLRTLATGFLDLSVAAVAPPPEARPKPAAPAPPPVPKPDPNRIYTAEDREVLPPVAVRQAMPRLPQNVVSDARAHGIVELVIDEQGRVISAAIRESVHPIYDALVLSAAREWRYKPAMFSGVPVKYRKLIQINVTRSQ